MEGTNTLELNYATVIAALQHYFDTVVYRDGKSPKVTSIRAREVDCILSATVVSGDGAR